MPLPVKIGIIGCGNVMAGPYMSLIERLGCQGLVEVTAACDRNEARGQFVQEKFGITNTPPVFEPDPETGAGHLVHDRSYSS